MDSNTVRRTGTAMSATADVSSLSTTASTRRMLEPPYTGISQTDLTSDHTGRCNHWSCTVRTTDDTLLVRASSLWPSLGICRSNPTVLTQRTQETRACMG